MNNSEVDGDQRWADFGEARSKVVTWYDPMALAASSAGLTGLEFLVALRDGRIPPPPMISLLGITAVSVNAGDVVFGCLPDESVYNPIGVVHGGLVCTLLDTVAGCAVHTTLPAGLGYTSIEIKVNYLRAVHATSGPLTAIGRVVKPGRRVAFAEGEILDARGATVATASSSLLVFPIPTA